MFSDRSDAGRQLAERLSYLRSENVVVVGLPRGGVPVAYEVACALDAPLDVILVRKLGVPSQPELGMGAIGEDGVRVLNHDIIRMARVTDQQLAAVEATEGAELDRRAQRYRTGRERTPLAGRTVVMVDDGIATGSTAKVACRVARAEGAARVILAVPVAPSDWKQRLAGAADELVSLSTPPDFAGVGQFYRRFKQTSDQEVVDQLDRAAARRVGDGQDRPWHPRASARDEDVTLGTGPTGLHGHLTVPDGAEAMVIFAHGSGSSRHSPRNRHVASILNDAGLATLLFDLLRPDEARAATGVFDIEMLAARLTGVTRFVENEQGLRGLPVGYFGASTGAAAALQAAASSGSTVGAVVSRGGRPDLAGSRLAAVTAPTLLIVGGSDTEVLNLNRQAQSRMPGVVRLEVVPGATHLFEEPGALEAVAGLARDWFVTHLVDAEHAPMDGPGC